MIYFYDAVKETTTTTGTGTITLAGAVLGFQSFAVVGNANITYYSIQHATLSEWEVGLGVYTTSGTTLSRLRVLSSSNSGSLASFSAGVKEVTLPLPGKLFGTTIPPVEHYKTTIDTPDDEFDAATLDGKWTAVDGSLTTVSLTGTTGGIYDLTTRPGFLLVQMENGAIVNLRQDYTLPDTKSVVAAFTVMVMSDADTGIASNELQAGLILNNTDSGPDGGVRHQTYFDANANGFRVITFDGTNTQGSTQINTSGMQIGICHRLYIRILRDNLTYRSFISNEGYTWMPLGSSTVVAAFTNVWLKFGSSAAFGTPNPIHQVDWIRLGGNGYDPW